MRIGVGCDAGDQLLEREGQHVSGTVATQEAGVVVSHLLVGDQEDGHLGLHRITLLSEDQLGDFPQSDGVDFVGLLVGQKDAHGQARGLVESECPVAGALLLRGSSINFRESSGRRSSDGNDRPVNPGRLFVSVSALQG